MNLTLNVFSIQSVLCKLHHHLLISPYQPVAPFLACVCWIFIFCDMRGGGIRFSSSWIRMQHQNVRLRNFGQKTLRNTQKDRGPNNCDRLKRMNYQLGWCRIANISPLGQTYVKTFQQQKSHVHKIKLQWKFAKNTATFNFSHLSLFIDFHEYL